MTAKRSWNRLGWLPIVERELRVSARQRAGVFLHGVYRDHPAFFSNRRP
jgi:hypothetical protein